MPERDTDFSEVLKAGRETEREEIPDGLAGGFVFDSGGEGGVSLVHKEEGQRCFGCV